MSTGTVYQDPPQSRNEAIIVATINGTQYTAPPQSRIEDLLLQLKEAFEHGGGGTGTHVEANPEDEATAELAKLKVASTTYSIPPEQVNTDWTALSGKAELLNKPTLGTAAAKNYTNEVDAGSIDLLTAGGAYEAIETVFEGAVQKSNVATLQTTLTASKPYVVGEQLYYKETLTLYTVTAPIAQGGTIVLSGEGANVEVSDKITDQIKDAKDGVTALDSEKLDKYATTPSDWDTTPTANSTKPVTSGGEYNTAVGGYQLVKDTVGYTGKNLWETSAFSSTSSSVGVIATLDTDKSILITGGNTGSGNNIITCGNIYLEAGDYILSGANGGSDAICLQVYSGPLSIDARDKGSGVAFTVTTAGTYRLAIYFTSSAQSLNLHFYPMIRRADIVDDTFEPYHETVDEQKADNSVIAPVEDGTNASQAYAVGSHFIRGGKFCTVTTAMAQGDAVAGKYTEGDVAGELQVVNTTPTLVENTIGVTLDNTIKYVKKYGKIVEFKVRFNVTASVTVTSFTNIINLGYPSLIDLYMFPVTIRQAPYANAAFSAPIQSNGKLSLPANAVLQAQEYEVSGIYLTK